MTTSSTLTRQLDLFAAWGAARESKEGCKEEVRKRDIIEREAGEIQKKNYIEGQRAGLEKPGNEIKKKIPCLFWANCFKCPQCDEIFVQKKLFCKMQFL